MRKYCKNTKDMSLDKKILWVICKVPHILLNDIHIDIHIDISDVDNVLNNNGDTICILESEYCGNYAAKKVIVLAINLLNRDIVLLKSSNYVLVILTHHSNYKFKENELLAEIDVYLLYESSII